VSRGTKLINKSSQPGLIHVRHCTQDLRSNYEARTWAVGCGRAVGARRPVRARSCIAPRRSVVPAAVHSPHSLRPAPSHPLLSCACGPCAAPRRRRGKGAPEALGWGRAARLLALLSAGLPVARGRVVLGAAVVRRRPVALEPPLRRERRAARQAGPAAGGIAAVHAPHHRDWSALGRGVNEVGNYILTASTATGRSFVHNVRGAPRLRGQCQGPTHCAFRQPD